MSDMKIPRVSDKNLLAVITDFTIRYKQPTASITTVGNNDIGNINLQVEPAELLKSILDHDGFIIQRLSLSFTFCNLNFYRGGPESDNPVFDVIRIDSNGATGSEASANRLEIVQLIDDSLNSFQNTRNSLVVPEYVSQLEAMHHSTLTRLSQVNEELIIRNAEFRTKLEMTFVQKETSLNQQLSEERLLLTKEYQDKSDAITAREKEVADKLTSIDDRDNTHARRQIRDSMLADVKARIQNFGVSKATENKRNAVALFLVSFAMVIVGMLTWHFMEVETFHTSRIISQNLNPAAKSNLLDWPLYYLWVRITILCGLLIGTLIYIVRWLNSWASRHADTEFQLQQFYLDVNRANWIIESCLEWRKETSSPIPTMLLESISHGLFESERHSEKELSAPADELASALLGTASKIKLKSGENEIEIDPKKLMKSKSADE